MGFPLRGRIQAWQATVEQVLDGDGVAYPVEIYRGTKKQERMSKQPLEGAEDIEDDMSAFTSKGEKRFPADMRSPTRVKRLPLSILRLLRFLVNKTILSRSEATISEMCREKQRSLASARFVCTKKDRVPLAVPQVATAAPASVIAAAASTTLVERRGLCEGTHWEELFRRSSTIDPLSAPQTVQHRHQPGNRVARKRRAATTSGAIPIGVSATAPWRRISSGRKRNGIRSRWLHTNMREALKGIKRSCAKCPRSHTPTKMHQISVDESAESLFAQCIRKHVVGRTSEEHIVLNKEVCPFRTPLTVDVGRRGRALSVKDKKAGPRAGEITTQTLDDPFNLCCCNSFHGRRGRGVTTACLRHFVTPVASTFGAAASAHINPRSTVKEDWEMVSYSVFARGYVMQQQSGRLESAPSSCEMETLSPFLCSAEFPERAAEPHVDPRARGVLALPSAVVSRAFGEVSAYQYGGLRKWRSLHGACKFCFYTTPGKRQGTQADPGTSTAARTHNRDFCLHYYEGTPVSSLKSAEVSYSGICALQAAGRLQADIQSLDNIDLLLQHQRSPVRHSAVVQIGGLRSVRYGMQQEDVHLKHSSNDIRRRRICRFQRHRSPADAAVDRQTGSTKDSPTLMRASFYRNSVLARSSRSKPQCGMQHPLLCPRRCMMWKCYCSSRGTANISSTSCLQPEIMQQPALRPRRSILVERNRMFLESAGESPSQHHRQRCRARNLVLMWKHLFTKKNKKRRLRLRFEAHECIAYYSMHQPPAANAFYRYTRLSTHVFIGDNPVRPPLQPRKKAAKELKSGMTAEEAIQWSLSSKNMRNTFTLDSDIQIAG